MKARDSKATISIDGGAPIPVSNVEIHRDENVPAYRRPLVGWPALYGRHWLTGQPLEGVYLRDVKRNRGGSVTLQLTVSGMAEFQAAIKGASEAVVRAGLRLAGERLFGSAQ